MVSAMRLSLICCLLASKKQKGEQKKLVSQLKLRFELQFHVPIKCGESIRLKSAITIGTLPRRVSDVVSPGAEREREAGRQASRQAVREAGREIGWITISCNSLCESTHAACCYFALGVAFYSRRDLQGRATRTAARRTSTCGRTRPPPPPPARSCPRRPARRRVRPLPCSTTLRPLTATSSVSFIVATHIRCKSAPNPLAIISFLTGF